MVCMVKNYETKDRFPINHSINHIRDYHELYVSAQTVSHTHNCLSDSLVVALVLRRESGFKEMAEAIPAILDRKYLIYNFRRPHSTYTG